MIYTHIDALDECLASSAISDESKKHLTAIREQMATARSTRKPTKQQTDNKAIAFGVDYTANDFNQMLTNHGFTTTTHRTLGLVGDLGVKKQTATFVDTDGKKHSLYRRS